MKFASTCIVIANKKHRAAAVQLNMMPVEAASVYAIDSPIITGTAAPVSVLGLAASSHALAEFCLIMFGSMFFFNICLQK